MVWWRKRDGTPILIEEMSEEYIRSCIGMLRRHIDRVERSEISSTMHMLSLPRPRGEMAELAFEQELDQRANDTFRLIMRYQRKIREFASELIKRDLRALT